MGRVIRNCDRSLCPVSARFIRLRSAKEKQSDDQQASTSTNDHTIPHRILLKGPNFLDEEGIVLFARSFVRSLAEVPEVGLSRHKCAHSTPPCRPYGHGAVSYQFLKLTFFTGRSLLFLHLMANASIEGNRPSTPATCPRLGLMKQTLVNLSDIGMVQIAGEHKLLELQPAASWDDYACVWIVADGSISFARLVTSLRNLKSQCTTVSIQPWAIRYPAHHKKNNPKLKRKRKPAQRAPPQPEPETALPKAERFFKRYTDKTDEAGCSITFALTYGEGEGQGTVVAARGTRKHAKGRWKYQSDDAFVSAENKPWSSIGLKSFSNATAKAGVLKWLTWIVQHTSVAAVSQGDGDS